MHCWQNKNFLFLLRRRKKYSQLFFIQLDVILQLYLNFYSLYRNRIADKIRSIFHHYLIKFDFYLNFFHSQFISKISHHFFNGHKIRPLIRKLLIYELCEIIKCYGPNNIPHSCNWVYWDWFKYSVHILRGPCLIKHSN